MPWILLYSSELSEGLEYSSLLQTGLKKLSPELVVPVAEARRGPLLTVVTLKQHFPAGERLIHMAQLFVNRPDSSEAEPSEILLLGR
jgi:hypothetical protein